MNSQVVDVAIIGGGASGALMAIRLLRGGFAGKLALVSKDAKVGRGIAYGGEDPHHLLNIRSGNMSLYPESPCDFVDWLADRGLDREGLNESFQPRILFGEYLCDNLESAVSASACLVDFMLDEAVSLTASGQDCRIGLRSGGELTARAVVLALGNLPTKAPKACEAIGCHPRWIGNPWKPHVLAQVKNGDTVAILGTGLTMVDVVISLKAQGHMGMILARSRHGLLPQVHRLDCKKPAEAPTTVHELIRACRRADDDWRGVVDCVRNRTAETWAALPWRQRQRIYQRLVPFWNVHRHRIPEAVAVLIDQLRRDGSLDIRGGMLAAASACGDSVNLKFKGEAVSADWLINCTGPSGDWRGARLPILESAVSEGLLQYDPLGLGIVVDEEGCASPGKVWALGPMCRGCRLETTAIPEIRAQARLIAERLLGKTG